MNMLWQLASVIVRNGESVMKYIKAGIAVLLLVLLDQWTKVLAVRHLMNTDGITFIPKFSDYIIWKTEALLLD